MFNELNFKGVKWNIETEGFEYKRLSDFQVGEVIKIYGLFITSKGKYGKSPVAICDGYYLNLPNHRLKDVELILEVPSMIQAIKDGKCAVEVTDYEKDGKWYKSVDFKDI